MKKAKKASWPGWDAWGNEQNKFTVSDHSPS
jgi:hypothetical protein